MKLFGTTTSPFVRRVRVVADETHQEIELVNTATDAGQAKLREVSPIRKVPVAVMDGRTLYDSHVIIEWILATRGWHDLAPPRDPWLQHNIVNAIDAAQESAIQLFYLRRDGVAVDGSTYATRQLERIDAIVAWLATQVVDGRSFGAGFGLAELALVTTLDWMDFRKTYATEGLVALNAVRAVWRDRTSLAATRPHA
jgi:glutathione S-transferase